MKRNHNMLFEIMIHGYTVVSIFNAIAFFTIDFWANYLFPLLGNQSIFYPFFGLLIADEIDSSVLVCVFLIYWVISVLLLCIGYLKSILQKKYKILLIVVFVDAAFTILFTVANIFYSGLMFLHFFMFLGAALDFVFGQYLLNRCKRSSVLSAA